MTQAASAGKLAAKVQDAVDDPETEVEIEDEEPETPEGEEPEGEDDDEVDEDELPPAVKAILQKNRRELRQAQRELKKARRGGSGDGDEGDSDARVQEATERGEKFRGLLVRQAAKSALLEAGLQGSPDRLVKMLDMDDIDITDDGEVDGLEEQIEDIKADFPDLFEEKKAPRKRAPRVRAAAGDDAPPAKKSSASKLAAGLK